MNAQAMKVAVLSRLLHWGVIFSVLCLGLFGAATVVFPGLSRSIDQTSRMVEVQIRETQAFMRDSKDMYAMLAELEKKAEFLSSRTLKAGEHAKVISAVAEATRSQGIEISSFKPVFSEQKEKAKTENKPLLPVLFELKIECDYKQLGGFFETIEDQAVLLSIVRYEAKTLKPGRISADITLSAYEEWSPGV